jgi:hypothetical protein
MPHRRLPNTLTAIIRQFTVVRDAWRLYPNARLIDQAQYDKLDDGPYHDGLLTRIIKETGDVPLALAAQAPLTEAANRGLAQLTLYVSHFYQVYDLGVARGVFTAGGRAYYGRDVSVEKLPDLRSALEVIELAGKIGPGELARRAAEGANSVAMALPSAAEVTAIYTAVKAQHDASLTAQAFTDLQQNELAFLYPDAQRLAVQLCNTVEYHLENDDAYALLDASGRRAIARRWGLVYIYDSNETPDPGDTNAANTTLPGPTNP